MRTRSLQPVRLIATVIALSGLLLAVSVGAATAGAEELTPWWNVGTGTRPSSLPAEGEGQVIVTAQDLGDTAAFGEANPVRIVDTLPKGLEAFAIKGIAGKNLVAGNRGPVTCALKTLTCTFSNSLRAFEQIEIQIAVKVKPEAHSGEVNRATASGGGAIGVATAEQPTTIGAPNRFGFEEVKLVPEEPNGEVDTQAGSHPFQLTSVVTFNSQTPDVQKLPRSVALPKDVIAELPAGLIGNPTPFAQCTEAQFAKRPSGEAPEVINECPAASAVGVATVSVNEPKNTKYTTITAPIFNLTPLPGEPARFGLKAAGIFPIFLDPSIRTGDDYGVTIKASNITEIGWPLSTKLTLWGVPGDHRHDGQRGWECLLGFGSCPTTSNPASPPFLSLPTSCDEPLSILLKGDSWGSAERPAELATPVRYTLPEQLDGCNRLPFAPTIQVAPEAHSASTSSGLNVDVHLPQETMLHPEGLAESAVKQITVSLPEGVAVNPSGADGLEACSETQVGFRASESTSESLLFTPSIENPFCPDAAKVGTIEIVSPLLPPGQHVTGSVYLATQNANPFGGLIAMYIIAEDPISGTIVKQAGEVQLSPTGQILATVKDVPQLAFEDAKLHFFGGQRAALATPAHCGSYETKAQFTPWSGSEAVNTASDFQITSGPRATPCPGSSLPLDSSVDAGSVNANAGAFTPFTTTVGLEDGDQPLSSVQIHTPPGLSGVLTGVTLCGEEQANQGTCGAGSLIGEATVNAGVGSSPITVSGGHVYLTGPYEGAPFGLSIVSPVKAGPFDLENTPTHHPACDCIVVRGRIEVDRRTAQLTVSTDPSGPHAIPQLIEGIPVALKRVNALINRPGFTFNPTNCDTLSLTSTITGAEGATQSHATPFQAVNCAKLGFAPTFSVSTSGRTSRLNGASLSVKLAYPKGSLGTQSNISSVKVELPKQLPSRITTLHKACLAAQFTENPAMCPPESVVGHAKVTTPILPVPLEGPAYFVSHGGEAFPSLTIVLQGYGVTVELVGSTFISKKSITSNTFKTTPDVPFNSFELVLPEGKFSALGAPYSLCKGKLIMPTVFKAQNGAEKRQATNIKVTGCPKRAVRKAKQKHR